jgi:hypothetical protein
MSFEPEKKAAGVVERRGPTRPLADSGVVAMRRRVDKETHSIYQCRCEAMHCCFCAELVQASKV